MRKLFLLLLHALFSSKVLCDIFVGPPPPHEKRLRDNLLSTRSWPVRPVQNFTDRLYVYLRFKLIRVADLNVKDQLLTLNVRIEHQWNDYRFQWDPDSYGGITHINIPSDSIWLPDFQLYNLFSNFDMRGVTAVVYSDGKIIWNPSVVLQTFCQIELRFYPFDIQTCSIHLGSWTYDGNMLYITLKDLPGNGTTGVLPVGMVLRDYYPSAEWELISIPGECEENYYSGYTEPYIGIHFNVTLRRHTQFYLVNLVMPLVGLSYLSLLVFYLPADSGEKITLCMTILTSQVLFLLVLIDNIPVTSLSVPLLGKIIVFNMVLVFLSVVCTTIVLNVYYRMPTTHSMPRWARSLRYSVFPKLLLLETLPLPMKIVTECEEDSDDMFQAESSGRGIDLKSRLRDILCLCCRSLQEIDRSHLQKDLKKQRDPANQEYKQKVFNNVQHVRNYIQRLQENNYECEDWKFLASILDRIFLFVFNAVFIGGTVVIMMDAPALYDHRMVIDRTLSLNEFDTQKSVQDFDMLPGNNSGNDVDNLLMVQGVVFYD